MTEDQESNPVARGRQNGTFVTQPPDNAATEREVSDTSLGTLEGGAPGQLHPAAYSMPGIVKWLSGFFTLTEEERFTAGIYIGNER